MPLVLVVAALLVLVLARGQAAAATYYVDPQSGSDTAAGTSGAPWETIPGTRTTNNSAFLRTLWGPGGGTITQTNRVACGDTLLLKGGTTHSTSTVTNGGAWRIDGSYYTATCTASNPITIRVATSAEWAGSASHFVVDGTGVSKGACDADNCQWWAGLVYIGGINGVVCGGNSVSQQLEVRNLNVVGGGSFIEHGVQLSGVSSASRMSGIKLQYINTHNNGGAGMDISWMSNSVLDRIVSHDNVGGGIEAGGFNDKAVDTTAIINSEIYGNGNTTEEFGSGDGMSLQGADSLWVIDTSSHDNYRRGVNLGMIGTATTRPMKFRFRNWQSYFNGLGCAITYPPSSQTCTGLHTPAYCCTGVGTNQCIQCYGWGWGGSGDGDITGEHIQAFLVGGVFWRNLGAGWGNYEGIRLDGWNMTFWGNGWQNEGMDLMYSEAAGQISWRNSIFQKRAYSRSLGGGYGSFNIKPISNWNLYRPVSTNSEPLSDFWFNGSTFTWASRTYSDTFGFTGANDKIGSAFTTGFTSTGGTCDTQALSPSTAAYATCDFHLQATSSAVNAGGYLFSTNGGGSGTTIAVTPNGLSSDPRDYFIAPASYLSAAPDTVQIKGAVCPSTPSDLGSTERAKIASMTATSIILDRSCTWSASAGVHLPWAGSTPDMGAYEFGLGGQGAPVTPVLLSVQPVPQQSP
jgi:hypothetical protein